MKIDTKFLAKSAIVASLYIVLTFAFYFLSYGMVQFRLAEIMALLAFIDSRYIYGLTLGCFIANILGPYGYIDAIFGTAASLFAFAFIVLIRNHFGKSRKSLFIASLGPALSSFIIAAEIVFVFGAEESFWLWTLMVAIGQFVVVSIGGYFIFSWLLNNEKLQKILKFDYDFINK